jgi:hypothetical protein
LEQWMINLVATFIDDCIVSTFPGSLSLIGDFENCLPFTEKWAEFGLKCFEKCRTRICETGTHTRSRWLPEERNESERTSTAIQTFLRPQSRFSPLEGRNSHSGSSAEVPQSDASRDSEANLPPRLPGESSSFLTKSRDGPTKWWRRRDQDRPVSSARLPAPIEMKE